MTLHRFKIFASVAKHRNETKAAQELHLSQSALSRHLAALQGQCGLLFRKNGRGLEITERGEAFYNEIGPILERIASLEKKYALKGGLEKVKSVLVGSSHSPATLLLPATLWAFKREYPNIGFEFRVSSSSAIQELIVNGDLDLAVITNPSPLESLEMEPFTSFELCVFVSHDHVLAAAREVSVETLARYPLVIRESGRARSRTDEVLSSIRAKGVDLDVAMRCDSPDAVKIIVEQGDAVGILYWENVKRGVRSGQFRTINLAGVDLTVVSCIIYSRQKALSKAAKTFLYFLRETGESANPVRS